MRFARALLYAAGATLVFIAFAGASSALATNTALCVSHEQPCAPEHLVTEITLESKSEPELLTNIGHIKCKGSKIKGNVLGLASPQIIHLTEWTWEECKAVATGTQCNAFSTLTPLGIAEVLRTALNLGELTFKGNSINVNCMVNVLLKCEYSGQLGPLHFAGAAGGAIGKGMVTAKGVAPFGSMQSGVFCPEQTGFDALYEPTESIFVMT